MSNLDFFEIDNNIYKCNRGVYGLFIKLDQSLYCAYVGRSEEVPKRINKHIKDIESGTHCSDRLNEAYKKGNGTIVIKLLEEVPYIFDNYFKDAQRLASAENRWIDEFQRLDQCLEQLPEGKRPNKERWKELKSMK